MLNPGPEQPRGNETSHSRNGVGTPCELLLVSMLILAFSTTQPLASPLGLLGLSGQSVQLMVRRSAS